MAGKIIAFRLGDMVYAVDAATETFKLLILPAITTTGTTYEDAGVDYQVPAGKTLKLLAGFLIDSTGTIEITVFQADAADSTTGEVDKFKIKIGTNRINNWIPFPNFPSIAAQKYVNHKTTLVNSSPQIAMIVGIES